jgi:hypothetical protein
MAHARDSDRLVLAAGESTRQMAMGRYVERSVDRGNRFGYILERRDRSAMLPFASGVSVVEARSTLNAILDTPAWGTT